MNKKLNIAFAITLSLFLLSVSANAATYFTANLTGAQETPTNASAATGFGRVTLNDAETQITASVYYGNPVVLGSNVTAGHIHTGAAGVSGPVTFNLAPATGATSGSVVNASFAVTAQQVADLKAGLMYFNIHTTGFSGGEIRGQLAVDAPYIAYMDNNQENPATTATARGSGFVSLNAATSQAIVTINWSGLTGNPTGAHMHNARVGVNGSVICPFTPPAATTGSIVDAICTLTAPQVTALKTAQLYLNVHTAANPGGEIRGQIQRRRSTVLDFDGDSKTDFVNTRTNTPNLTTDWWIGLSGGGSSAFSFGLNTDNVRPRTVGCDFDGDGKDDPAIWRTGASPAAAFYILQSSTSTVRTEQFGTTSDNPSVVYDYDGDGRCDPAVYRPSAGTWFFLGSSNNPARNITYVVFGSGSFPNPGDYDGDGRGDFMVQGSGSSWWTLNSSDLSVKVTQFGTGSFFGTPGDFDGDGKTDVAGSITESGNRAWYYVSSVNPTQSVYNTRVAWGDTTSQRAQGDYDGDGKTDVGVWVTSTAINPTPTYWALPSGGGSPIIYTWGISTDVSVNNYNNR